MGFGLSTDASVRGVHGGEQRETVGALLKVTDLEHVEVVTGSYHPLVRFRVLDQEYLRERLFNGLCNVPGMHRIETLICLGDGSSTSFGTDIAAALPK
ncbi:MAG: hypothetical protein ACRDX8_04275 [Acidimicrobiales bacterium]